MRPLCGVSLRESTGRQLVPHGSRMLDTYAYVYETGDVICKRKDQLEETGSREYQEAAGEP